LNHFIRTNNSAGPSSASSLVCSSPILLYKKGIICKEK
jgi:hypothetical protein